MDLPKLVKDELMTFVDEKKLESTSEYVKCEEEILQACVNFTIDENDKWKTDELKKVAVSDIIMKEEGKLNVDLTPLVGQFQPVVLGQMINLQYLDISGCKIDVDYFLKEIVKCTKLETIIMQSCKSFTEYQIVQMCRFLPKLRHLDAIGATPILASSAYQIITEYNNITVLKVEPKMPEDDRKNWCQLRATFLHINFGPVIHKLISNK